MTTTLALIEAELQELWSALGELDRKIGGDTRQSIIFDDDRTDLIDRINALEALRLHYVAPGYEEIICTEVARGGLRVRLVKDRAAALREQGQLDEASIAGQDDPTRNVSCDLELRKIGRFIFALEAGIAALRPKANDDDEALVSAVRICDEVLDHGVTDQNRAHVEMLARGLLEWHVARAGKSPAAVLGMR